MFFLVSVIFTALCQAPGIAVLRTGAMPVGPLMLLLAIGSAGPTLVAMAMSAWVDGRRGVRALLARRGQDKVPFYVFALSFFFVAHMLGSLGLWAIGRYAAHHIAYPPLLPEQMAIAIVAPLGEEYGWRAYALPRLQTMVSPLRASLLIGVVWALWHVPTLFAPGASLDYLLIGLPMYLAGSVILTALFNASGGSMRILVAAHLGVHLDNVSRAVQMGDGMGPFYATSAVLVLMALGLVASGRLHAKHAVMIQ